MEQIKWNELNRYSSDFTYGISLKIEDKLENTVSSPVKDVIFGIAIVDHPYFKSTHYFSMSFSI
jgi:hypothetical protein